MSGLPSPSLATAGPGFAPPPPAVARAAPAEPFRVGEPAAVQETPAQTALPELIPEALLLTLQALMPPSATLEAEPPPVAVESASIESVALPAAPMPATGGRTATVRIQAARTPPCPLPPDEPSQALAARVTWLAEAGIKTARIELHPQELGALSIRIDLRGDEAHVSFQAERPAARALLQSALPQLRHLLSVQRLSLAGAEVRGMDAPEADEPFSARPARRVVVGIVDELA